MSTTEGDWRCPGCGEVLTDDDLEPLYECQDCGTTFGRSDSADGDSHRCPDCNKFAARYGETHDGCGCGEQVEELSEEGDES